jgi:hypothetical protein
MRRGAQIIQLFTHPVAAIAHLAAHPEILSAWRRADLDAVRLSGRFVCSECLTVPFAPGGEPSL